MQPRTTTQTGVGRSTLIRLDTWAGSQVGVQLVVTGTATYTLQQSFDDPNDPVSPIAQASMNWANCPDLGAVNSSASFQTWYNFVPTFISVNVTAGTGSVRMTVSQNSAVPY